MAGPRAADDFANIRARMKELRRERMKASGGRATEAGEHDRPDAASFRRVFGVMRQRGPVEVIVVES